MEPTLTSNHSNPPDSLLKGWDHRHVPPDLAKIIVYQANIYIQPASLPNFSNVNGLNTTLP